MVDLVIPDVDWADVQAVEKKAAHLGLSRDEYLRQTLFKDAQRQFPTRKLTMDDFKRLAEILSPDRETEPVEVGS